MDGYRTLANLQMRDVFLDDSQPKASGSGMVFGKQRCLDAEGHYSDTMNVDKTSKSTRINTHGPRNSRREQWRLSKGMSARPERKGVNRQGGVSARRNAEPAENF